MAELNLPKVLMLTVTQEDIDTAECGDSQRCAVAKALMRETGAPDVMVLGSNGMKVFESPTSDSWYAPAAAYYDGGRVVDEFIRRFDLKDTPRTQRETLADMQVGPPKPHTFRLVRRDVE